MARALGSCNGNNGGLGGVSDGTGGILLCQALFQLSKLGQCLKIAPGPLSSVLLRNGLQEPWRRGYANPNFPFLSFHRVFKKASPNGKVSVQQLRPGSPLTPDSCSLEHVY